MRPEGVSEDASPATETDPEVPTLVGDSDALHRIREEIGDLAAFDEPVLVVGETGVGKELVARALHARSHRRRRPLEVVNCGGLTGELLAAELFGHRAGAFTGARRDRRGRVLAAQGSSLLLDEVSETPHALQVALLRAVEYGEIQPVGSDRRVEAVDVRYLATSNRPLTELRSGESMRSDLYHRLAALTITIPPLRERPADIAPLAEHFLEDLARRHGRRRHLGPGALKLLRHHAFPGNVRELRHVLLQAYARASGDVLHAEDIAAVLSRNGGADLEAGGPPTTTMLALQDVIREHIRFVLHLSEGNLSRAARLMDLPRSTLQHYLVKYGVERPNEERSSNGQERS